MKNCFLTLVFLSTYGIAAAQSLDKGVPLKNSNGNQIFVETSHAAPCLYDFNKDGLNDLLVGEFGEDPVDPNSKEKHSFVKSKCRIYINNGSKTEPVYDKYSYLQAGGEDAYVPVTCCISFVPRFTDLNNDGINDVITGDYPGDIHLFKGRADGTFDRDTIIVNMGKLTSISVEPVDWNDDGLIDLLVSYRYGNPHILINKGTKEIFDFLPARELELEQCKYVYEPMNQERKSTPSHVYPTDFNNDGLFDLVCGDEWGNIFWYKNFGSEKESVFKTPQLLFDNNDNERTGEEVSAVGGRLKLWVYDANNDGKKDILCGDTYTLKMKGRELSPKEEKMRAKYEVLKADCLKQWDEFIKRRGDMLSEIPTERMPVKDQNYNQNIDKLLPTEFLKDYNKCTKRLSQVFGEARKYDTNNYISKGFLWLFLQK